jgi:sugar lactone lactonase YvrE
MNMSKAGSYSLPEIFIPAAGIANGLFYDDHQHKIFLSSTLDGIYNFSPSEESLNEVYLKLKFMEACDDLCTDISGNVWMTDPGMSTIKIFNPGTNRLVRFVIDGIGQTSSCRIRSENGQEMLFITELKQSQRPASGKFDGRGVLIVPANSLLKLLEPILINNINER